MFQDGFASAAPEDSWILLNWGLLVRESVCVGGRFIRRFESE
ncbi:hypothetical protein A2U01_0019004 [Trifolium medium]|uniref:Uncharacterized protein n=1 Tax=Trifolium medium TaxID=97028 RepID=A0A392NFT8_9FABA|nr:hypothetical protein [Trifolium medium]